MDVTSDGKWFSVEPPGAPVVEAAEQILALRLQDVQRYLPLAAHHHGDDIEHVHQLRVSCRRAAAALRAFSTLAPRRSKKLGRWLKRIRRAAGPARDADVLVARLRDELNPDNGYAQQLVAVVLQSRCEAQEALVAIDAKTAGGGFQRAADKCLKSIRNADDGWSDCSFIEFAREAIASAAEGLHGVDPSHAAAELHELRIAGKRLRYAIEIFHSAGAPELRADVYPQIEELQERLGAVNDRAASQLRLQRWLGELPADGLAAFAAAQVVSEHAATNRLRDEFMAWWTADRQSQLREQLGAAFA
jgi:CHAD domain-containing protein